MCVKLSNIVDGTSTRSRFSEIVKGVGGFANNLDNLTPSATPVKLSAAASGVSQTDYTAARRASPHGQRQHRGIPARRHLVVGPVGPEPVQRGHAPNGFSCDFGVTTPTATPTRSRPAAATPGSRQLPDDGRFGPRGEV